MFCFRILVSLLWCLCVIVCYAYLRTELLHVPQATKSLLPLSIMLSVITFLPKKLFASRFVFQSFPCKSAPVPFCEVWYDDWAHRGWEKMTVWMFERCGCLMQYSMEWEQKCWFKSAEFVLYCSKNLNPFSAQRMFYNIIGRASPPPVFFCVLYDILLEFQYFVFPHLEWMLWWFRFVKQLLWDHWEELEPTVQSP